MPQSPRSTTTSFEVFVQGASGDPFVIRVAIGGGEQALREALAEDLGDVEAGELQIGIHGALEAGVRVACARPGEDLAVAQDLLATAVPPPGDPIIVCLAADPAHVPDDALPLEGVVTWGEDGELALGPSATTALVPPFRVEKEGGQKRCKLASLAFDCARIGCDWSPKDPSPLMERVDEIGGCEYLRIAKCPMCIGYFRPEAALPCASGEVTPRSELPPPSREKC